MIDSYLTLPSNKNGCASGSRFAHLAAINIQSKLSDIKLRPGGFLPLWDEVSGRESDPVRPPDLRGFRPACIMPLWPSTFISLFPP
jgi:hypothetical protein